MTEPLIQVVLQAVARYYAIDPSELQGRSRHKSVVVPRHTAMYVARLAGDYSYPQLAQFFGRDHSSVINACGKMAYRTTKDALFAQTIQDLLAEVREIGVSGRAVKIRHELVAKLQLLVDQGIYGKSIEDLVDRILCAHFQGELTARAKR